MIDIVLASASAARAALLRQAGIGLRISPADIDEEAVKRTMLAGGQNAAAVAARLAEMKAQAVSARDAGLVIGADQTLELDGVLHDKTRTLAETRARLRALRGRTHHLHSAVSLALGGTIIWRCLASASLTMREFSDAFLDDYLRRHGDAVRASVGAYHLEGAGVQLFAAISGDYFAILGLPLVPLLEALREAGAVAT